MQTELKALQRRLGITFLFITHDQHEALSMSDRIGVFNQGRLEQVGAPHAVYNAPATRFVAQFVGAANVLDGDAARALTGHASAMLRPERIRVGAAAGARASGTVREVQYFGAFTRIKADVRGLSLQADLPESPGAPPPELGAAVHLHWDERAVHALDAPAALQAQAQAH
jgi:putative spermidine/putrescine transport system ATP-binding protein